jgi:TRAP-type uncharacterized transport system fused permease subunit
MAGMIAIGAGVIGYWMRGMNWLERVLAVIVGLLLIYPETVSDIIGISAFIVLLALQYLWKNDNHDSSKILENSQSIEKN